MKESKFSHTVAALLLAALSINQAKAFSPIGVDALNENSVSPKLQNCEENISEEGVLKIVYDLAKEQDLQGMYIDSLEMSVKDYLLQKSRDFSSCWKGDDAQKDIQRLIANLLAYSNYKARKWELLNSPILSDTEVLNLPCFKHSYNEGALDYFLYEFEGKRDELNRLFSASSLKQDENIQSKYVDEGLSYVDYFHKLLYNNWFVENDSTGSFAIIAQHIYEDQNSDNLKKKQCLYAEYEILAPEIEKEFEKRWSEYQLSSSDYVFIGERMKVENLVIPDGKLYVKTLPIQTFYELYKKFTNAYTEIKSIPDILRDRKIAKRMIKEEKEGKITLQKIEWYRPLRYQVYKYIESHPDVLSASKEINEAEAMKNIRKYLQAMGTYIEKWSLLWKEVEKAHKICKNKIEKIILPSGSYIGKISNQLTRWGLEEDYFKDDAWSTSDNFWSRLERDFDKKIEQGVDSLTYAFNSQGDDYIFCGENVAKVHCEDDRYRPNWLADPVYFKLKDGRWAYQSNMGDKNCAVYNKIVPRDFLLLSLFPYRSTYSSADVEFRNIPIDLSGLFIEKEKYADMGSSQVSEKNLLKYWLDINTKCVTFKFRTNGAGEMPLYDLNDYLFDGLDYTRPYGNRLVTLGFTGEKRKSLRKKRNALDEKIQAEKDEQEQRERDAELSKISIGMSLAAFQTYYDYKVVKNTSSVIVLKHKNTYYYFKPQGMFGIPLLTGWSR